MAAAIALSLAPVVGLIALGFGLRRSGFLSEAFWPQAERLSYFVLLPALLVHSLAVADLREVPVARFAAVLVLSLFAAAGLLLLFRPRNEADGPAYTSIFQGGIRFNNYVGVTAAVGLLGAPGAALAALANAVIVPTVNVLCILVFARYAHGQVSPARIVRSIAKNPLVLACALGALLQVSGLGLPPGLEGLVRALGQASLPLGLFCVGASFDPGAIRRGFGAAALASAVKFGALPLITFVACLGLGVRGPSAMIALLFQSLPTASSAYILARQLGGDAPLMAGIVTLQTLVAALAIPVALVAATRWLG